MYGERSAWSKGLKLSTLDLRLSTSSKKVLTQMDTVLVLEVQAVLLSLCPFGAQSEGREKKTCEFFRRFVRVRAKKSARR